MQSFQPSSTIKTKTVWQRYWPDIVFQGVLLLVLFWIYQDCGSWEYRGVFDTEGRQIVDGDRLICLPSWGPVFGWMLFSVAINVLYRHRRELPFLR